MFKDLPEGRTHYENDGCGEPAHNKLDWRERWDNLEVTYEDGVTEPILINAEIEKVILNFIAEVEKLAREAGMADTAAWNQLEAESFIRSSLKAELVEKIEGIRKNLLPNTNPAINEVIRIIKSA